MNACRDPELLRISERPSSSAQLVLGLDLGTLTGIGLMWVPVDGRPFDPAVTPLHAGLWDLSAGSYDSGAIRFVRLRQFLSIVKPDLIGYEEPKYTPQVSPNRVNVHAIVARAATACELFGALKSTVATWAEEAQVPCVGWPVGTIKKRGTGRGNCDKKSMVAACNALFGTDFEVDTCEQTGLDNVADAAFVTLLTVEQYAKGLTPGGTNGDLLAA